MKTVIIVNGVPASGKSTTAKLIAEEFNCPYLSIDAIKEPFMEIHSNIDRELNRELGKAAYKVIWDTISNSPDNCIYVVDAWFGFQPKELLLEYLNSSNIDNVIEVWNEISPDLVVERYKQRLPFRKEGHPGPEYLPELEKLAKQAKPMNVGKTFCIKQDCLNGFSELIKNISSIIHTTTPQKAISNF